MLKFKVKFWNQNRDVGNGKGIGVKVHHNGYLLERSGFGIYNGSWCKSSTCDIFRGPSKFIDVIIQAR